MWGSVAEVLLGQQQQSFAIHLEGPAGDGPQGELLLGPAQPLRHVLPVPEDRLQAWRGRGHVRISPPPQNHRDMEGRAEGGAVEEDLRKRQEGEDEEGEAERGREEGRRCRQ